MKHDKRKKQGSSSQSSSLPKGVRLCGSITWNRQKVDLMIQPKTGSLVFFIDGKPVEDDQTINHIKEYLLKANDPSA